MNEYEIKAQLDTLAEFEAQRDMIDINKRKLLDDVKIPEEIEAIVKDGMNKAAEIEKQYASKIAAIRSESNNLHFGEELNILRKQAQDQLNLIVIPEEIKAALAEIDKQRAEVTNSLRAKEAEIERKIAELRSSANSQIAALENQAQLEKEKMRLSVEEQTKQVYVDIAKRKADIEAEFAGSRAAVDDNIKKLTELIKANVKDYKKSVKGDKYHAIYVNGRITWNTDKMEAWMIDHPFLAEARKEGEPSISIRRI